MPQKNRIMWAVANGGVVSQKIRKTVSPKDLSIQETYKLLLNMSLEGAFFLIRVSCLNNIILTIKHCEQAGMDGGLQHV